MFPRVATVKRSSKTYKYLQIVEAYRVNGRITQRAVANLGRLGWSPAAAATPGVSPALWASPT